MIDENKLKEQMFALVEQIGDERLHIDAVVHLIDDAPAVDAVPVVHGRWIDIDTETYTWKIRCSKCGHERSMMSTGQTYPMYCEDCGARMDGKGNGNETD